MQPPSPDDELARLLAENQALREQVLNLRAENQALREKVLYLRDARRDAVRLLAEALETKDSVTRGHSNRVRKMSVEMGRELGVPPEELERIELGAFLHDLGKMGVRDDVLKKPGKLTEDEYSHMQSHPELGMHILEASQYFADVIPLVRHHHEKWDGSGYPGHLAGEAIPLGSRIIAICDTFDTIVSDRPYKKPLPQQHALDVLRGMAGRMFDPRLVEIFITREIYVRVTPDYSSATSF